MNQYDILKKEWEEAADLRSLFRDIPRVFRWETRENRKEDYQELQGLLQEIAGKTGTWDFRDPGKLTDLSLYLLMLAKTIPEIDEEVFDHKMNVVRQYRNTLKAVLCVYGDLLTGKHAAEELHGSASEPAGICKDLSAEECGEAYERIRESIRIACDNRALIREKYQQYL